MRCCSMRRLFSARLLGGLCGASPRFSGRSPLARSMLAPPDAMRVKLCSSRALPLSISTWRAGEASQRRVVEARPLHGPAASEAPFPLSGLRCLNDCDRATVRRLRASCVLQAHWRCPRVYAGLHLAQLLVVHRVQSSLQAGAEQREADATKNGERGAPFLSPRPRATAASHESGGAGSTGVAARAIRKGGGA